MGLKRTDELRKDAVGHALAIGLTRKQVVDDLGVGRVSAEQTDHGARHGCGIEAHQCAFSSDRMSIVMDVSPRGLRAFRTRPASRRP